MDGSGWSVFRNNFLLFSPGSAEHSETRPIQSEASGQRIPGRENAQVHILAKKRRLLLSTLMKKQKNTADKLIILNCTQREAIFESGKNQRQLYIFDVIISYSKKLIRGRPSLRFKEIEKKLVLHMERMY
jgi:hypothetical protein